VLAALEQRLEALRRELRGPVLGLLGGKVVVEEVARVGDELGEPRRAVDAPRGRGAAQERVHEGDPREGEAGGYEDDADDVPVG